MTRTFIFILTNLLALSLFGQNIKLAPTKSADDLKVTNGKYVIYLKKADVVAAIAEIDKITKTDNSNQGTLVKSDKIKSIDLNSGTASDKLFIGLLKSNLGALLLSQGKAAIYNGTNFIKEIAADESPEMEKSDGTSKVTILFAEPNMDTPVFLGDLNTKLKNAN